MQEDRHETSKDKDCQDFLAGIKELTRELMQIRERAAIEYAPIVEEFCTRKHASENEVERMLDHLLSLPTTNAYCSCTRRCAEDSFMNIPKPSVSTSWSTEKNMTARVLSGPNTNICFTRMTTCLTKGVTQNSRLQRRESYLLNAAHNHNIYPIFFFYID